MAQYFANRGTVKQSVQLSMAEKVSSGPAQLNSATGGQE